MRETLINAIKNFVAEEAGIPVNEVKMDTPIPSLEKLLLLVQKNLNVELEIQNMVFRITIQEIIDYIIRKKQYSGV